jgi:MFS family permease
MSTSTSNTSLNEVNGSSNPHLPLVIKDFRWNMIFVILFEFIWGMGLPFALTAVIVPAYLNFLDAPKVVIGIVTALGVILTPMQLIAIRWMGGRNRKYKLWLIYSLCGISYLLFGLFGCILPLEAKTLKIILFISMSFIFWIGVIFCDPVYRSLLIDNCPLERRGFMFGLQAAGLGLGGLINIYPAQWLYQTWSSPDNYHYALIVSGFFLTISTAAIAFIRDHVDPVRLINDSEAEKLSIILEVYQLLKRMWKMINYRIFLFFLIILTGGISLTPFMVTYTSDILSTPAGLDRWFNYAFLLSLPVSGFALGFVADRWGYRLVFILLSSMLIFAFLMAIFTGKFWIVLVAYGVVSIVSAKFTSVICNISVELLPRENPAQLVAAANIFSIPVSVILPALAGRILDINQITGHMKDGYTAVFMIGILLAIIAGLGALFLVQEPRTGKTYILTTLHRS